MPKAVIFDLFETLITEWGHEKYTKRMLAEDLGIPERKFREQWDALHETQYRGGISFADSVRHVCTQCGVSVSDAVLAHVTDRRITTKSACFDALHPDILPMLHALRADGYRIAILSNCSEEEVSAARESVLALAADRMLLSYETGFCKPEPEIYHLAADALGVSCVDCIFIGDGGSRELYGAAAVGMTSYRAMWYIRQMPYEIKPMPEFAALETPLDVLSKLEINDSRS